MRFATLVLTLFAAATASAVAVEKRYIPHFYLPTFLNLHTATPKSPDYLTYTLVRTIGDCFHQCDGIIGCGFVNTYHDVFGKNGSPLLTCAMFKSCHYADKAYYRDYTIPPGRARPGPDPGSYFYIINNSDGYCRYNETIQ